MSIASSSAAWKADEVIPDQFPAGLRVLAVDDDPTCLKILEKMLQTCHYDVKKCNRAETALSLLRQNKNGFDIVISDVHMPDMDGFKLLEHIGLEMDLPVIMMSADDGKNVVMKGVTHGACDYLIKPVRLEALKNIWQHIVRKKKNEWKDLEQSGSVEEGDRQQKPSEDVDYSSSANEGSWRNSKRRNDDEEDQEERDDTSTMKKPRVVWSIELHQQFVAAVNQLGIDKAVPKRILELMNVPGLTRENVASHLQKYRLYLRRLSGVSQHQSNLNNSFMGPQEVTFGPMSSFNGLDLQTLAVAGQLSPHSLATLQAAGLGRSTEKSDISTPLVDQRNIFSFENPKLRFGEGQQQHMNNSKPMNLLHGIPTTMEPKQLANLHHSAQSHPSMHMQVKSHGGQSNSLLMQMPQPRDGTDILNETTSNHGPRIPGSMGQSMISNGYAGYNNLVPSTSSMLHFPMNQTADLSGNCFPLQSMLVTSSNNTSKVAISEDLNSEIKESGKFLPSYDIYNNFDQQKFHYWDLHNVGSTFDGSQPTNFRQGKAMFSLGEETEHGNMQNNGRQFNSVLIDNSVMIKSESISDARYENGFFPEQHFGQDDLLSALLKQQQEGTGRVENELSLDGFPVDNINV